jgi:hypothetical protein
MSVLGVLHPEEAGSCIWRAIRAVPEDHSSKGHRRILPQSLVTSFQLEQLEQLEPEAGLMQS